MTTQGMKEPQASEVGSLISRVLKEYDDDAALTEVTGRVSELAEQSSPYPRDFAGYV